MTVEAHDEAQPALRQMLSRVERYANLVALLSLLVAGVGVAQSVAAWLREAGPETAILRCLGLRARDVFALYVGLVALAAIAGSSAAASIAAFAPRLVGMARPDLVPSGAADALPIAACLRGAAMGIMVALACSIFSLTALWRAAPAAVLRSDALPLPVSPVVRVTLGASATLTLFVVCLLQSGDAWVALIFAAGFSVIAATLIALARGLAYVIAQLPRERMPWWVWHGLAAVARPGSGMTGSVLALGLGSLVVLSIALQSELLQRALETALPPNAPTMFLVDIQPDQADEVASIARAAGVRHVDFAPIVMARLRAIDDVPIKTLLAQRPVGASDPERMKRLLTREQRLSWLAKLPDDNHVVASLAQGNGSLWSEPDRDEVSVELEFAKELGIELGTTLHFDVQGVPRSFHVSSLRTVQWRSFSTNFFMLVEPGSLDDAPSSRIAALRAKPAAETSLESTLAARVPNVTTLRVRSLIARADETFAQLALGVQWLGAFAVLSGLLTLGGSVASSHLRRRREVALLKTLGVTRLGVVRMFALEYVLQGAVAGATGALAAYFSTWIAARQLLELTELPSVSLTLFAVLLTATLSVASGLVASGRALWVRPLYALRGRG